MKPPERTETDFGGKNLFRQRFPFPFGSRIYVQDIRKGGRQIQNGYTFQCFPGGETLTQEERRRFWRGIIKEIVFKDKDIVDVIFL